MRALVKKFVLAAAWLLLRLRYRIRVTGLESVQAIEGATLVLPNHPAYIDPVMVLTEVKLPVGLPRPVVYTETFRMPPLYPLMRAVDAVEVPDLRRAPRRAAKATRELIEQVAEGLERGQSFLIYPSGRLQREDIEKIGTARMTHDLLSRCGNVHLVLVRVRGVWGSVFSCAPTGDVPDLKRVFWLGVPRLLGSLILFLPRRQVWLHVETIRANQLLEMNRAELNQWLEAWYNHDGGEHPIHIPYHRLQRRQPRLDRTTSGRSRRRRSIWRRVRDRPEKVPSVVSHRAQESNKDD